MSKRCLHCNHPIPAGVDGPFCTTWCQSQGAKHTIQQERKTMSDNSSSSSGGIGFVGLLTIVFIALKLTGYIAWSWVWVLSPIWISILIGVVIFILGVSYAITRD